MVITFVCMIPCSKSLPTGPVGPQVRLSAAISVEVGDSERASLRVLCPSMVNSCGTWALEKLRRNMASSSPLSPYLSAFFAPEFSAIVRYDFRYDFR